MNEYIYIYIYISRIATFNVCGLSSLSKQQQLARDLQNYRIDFCGVQELKITEPFDKRISQEYRLVGFGQSAGRHGGIGFVVSNKFEKFISKYKRISDSRIRRPLHSSEEERFATSVCRRLWTYEPISPEQPCCKGPVL